MEVKVGLCGRTACRRLCVRSEYCGPGRARSAWLLELQRQRRIQRHQDQRARWLVVGQAIEANVIRLAGPFEAFQRRLLAEARRRKDEQSQRVPSV